MQLREHQSNAIKAFEEYYYTNENSRGILSMCCGSGKTYTFYKIMKKCIEEHNEDFFIYATSRILLVKGIIKDIIEWSYNDKLDLDILIKVSDFNINEIYTELLSKFEKNNKDTKELEKYLKKIKQSNVKLLNDISDIKDVLKARYILEKKKIIIITTYDSVEKIVNAISDYNSTKDENLPDIIPNLLTADESHNLASENNKIKIAKQLLEIDEEKRFFPEKYLFMTATPLKIIKRNKESCFNNDEIIYSMDNEKIYGNVFFEYTFYEGIHNYPPCVMNFDVVYLDDYESKDEDLNNLVDNLRFTDKEEQQIVYFNSISQILLKIILKYNLKNILIFVSNQSKLRVLKETLEKYKTNEELFYIISDQSPTDKRNNKKNFEEASENPKILLSVDILNEGIDIPLVDSVFFAEERNSETIIVQNIGRALRLHPRKNKAYVILPTKIYSVENSEESSFSSRYKTIRRVCDILREAPDENTPKFYNRKTKGNTKSFKNENEDEIINEKSGLVDDIVNVNMEEIIEKNINIQNISNERLNELCNFSGILANSFNIKTSNDKISNIDLSKLKQIVQIEVVKGEIRNLNDLYLFLIEKNIITNKPHKYYKSEWICYGDFLYNKVFTYEESINFIKNLKFPFSSSKDWLDYYNNILELSFNNSIIDEEQLQISKDIIYVPYDPKTFYLENWDNQDNNLSGWEKFLGKELENIVGLEISSTKSSVSVNAENNFKNLINSDKDKIKNLLINKWQSFENYSTDCKKLINFIETLFGSLTCEIDIRFLLDKRYSITQECINVHIKTFPKEIVPIVIEFTGKINYTSDIHNIDLFRNKISNPSFRVRKEDRKLVQFICNKEVQEVLDNLYKELTSYVKNRNS